MNWTILISPLIGFTAALLLGYLIRRIHEREYRLCCGNHIHAQLQLSGIIYTEAYGSLLIKGQRIDLTEEQFKALSNHLECLT